MKQHGTSNHNVDDRFWAKRPIVAEMKAIILGICPSARIVDLSHEIERFNVEMGAYVLATASAYFPKGTINVAIVDPTVGTNRKPILIETGRAFFLGPDNGLLTLACPHKTVRHVYEISNRNMTLSTVSATFQGRDVFAPAAAHLALGKTAKEFGEHAENIVRPTFADAVVKGDVIKSEVLYVDSFGNVVLNARKNILYKGKTGQLVSLKARRRMVRVRFCKTYGEVDECEPLLLVGSHGFLELSINLGNAAEGFGLKIGDKVSLRMNLNR